MSEGTPAISKAAGESKRGGSSRLRVVGARALTVLAILLALVGMLAYYVAHTALDEAGFEAVSRNMIENDEIRTQVANTAVDSLYANVDVEAAIAERLPEAQKGLAPVLAGLSRSGADRAAVSCARAAASPAGLGGDDDRDAAAAGAAAGRQDEVPDRRGKVVLDLRPIVIQIGDKVAIIGRVAEKLPESAGKITIVDESQLETAQTITRILRAVADWMWLIALAVAALAIWLARGRRRIELRALAIGVLAVGLLMLVVRRAAGGYLVDNLAKDDSVKPAVGDAWNILTQVLADRAWVWIILGVVTLVGVWFVGDTRRAGQARHAAQPVLENRLATYAIAAGAVLVLGLIAPLFARGWTSSLILLALIIVGVEVVRNIVQREAATPDG